MQGRVWIAMGLVAMLAGPALAKDKVKSEADLSAWMGMWMAGPEQQISIAPGIDGGLNIDGYATFGAADPESAAMGAVNVGSFAGNVPADWIENGKVRFASDGEDIIAADAAGKYDCVVDMSLVREQILLVTDNGQCGGLNVSFTETYRRVD